MGAATKIEWADASWNPLRARHRASERVGWHCVHESDGCANCYAEVMNVRLGTGVPYKAQRADDVQPYLDARLLLQPLAMRAPRAIFVCSMTDLFAAYVREAWHDQIFALMAMRPDHRFVVLTKRDRAMQAYVARVAAETHGERAARFAPAVAQIRAAAGKREIEPPAIRWPLPNVWLGVSCERARHVDRIWTLMHTPAAGRFVSFEPLLDDVATHIGDVWRAGDTIDGRPALDGVIVGGESGALARPMHPDWARNLRDIFLGTEAAFHFKQWGAWSPSRIDAPSALVCTNGAVLRDPRALPPVDDPRAQTMGRVGKEAAGRILDGRTHDETPWGARPKTNATQGKPA